MPTRTKDLYAVLGIAENATTDEIKRAYRKLAKENHPDANRGDEAAAERFKEISEAYAVLSNEEKRAQYDQMRKMGAFTGAGRAGPGGGWRETAGRGGGFSFEGMEFGGLGDLFGSIFDFGRRRGGARGSAASAGTRSRRGSSVEYAVDLPFELAARGGKLPISVPVTEPCGTCGGSGARPGTTPTRCPECEGAGQVSFGQGGFAVSRPCPACYGRGSIATDPCPACEGRGQRQVQRRIQVTVPAGVDTGSKLRLAGQGERSESGGPPGDLILTFRVQPHRFFRREGLDVHCTVPVNIAQATLGSKIRVRTVDGGKVALRIPPGTQSGTRFRVPGQGIRKDGQRGDQYVRVRVSVPAELGERERRLMEELAQAAELPY